MLAYIFLLLVMKLLTLGADERVKQKCNTQSTLRGGKKEGLVTEAYYERIED